MRWAIRVIAALGSLASGVGAASGSATGAPSAMQVVVKLKAAGLPIGAFRVYNETNDRNQLLGRPGQYTSKVNFHDKRVAPSRDFDVTGGGAVEVFAIKADAKRRYEYIAAIGKSPLFSGYDYLEGKALLRLSHILTPTQAKKSEAVFRRLV